MTSTRMKKDRKRGRGMRVVMMIQKNSKVEL